MHCCFRTKWVKADGCEYKKGAGLVIQMKQDLPHIGKISTIYILNNDTIVFRVLPFYTQPLPHFQGYILHSPPEQNQQLVYISQLAVHIPVHIRMPQSLPRRKFVILPFYVHCDLWCYCVNYPLTSSPPSIDYPLTTPLLQWTSLLLLLPSYSYNRSYILTLHSTGSYWYCFKRVNFSFQFFIANNYQGHRQVFELRGAW